MVITKAYLKDLTYRVNGVAIEGHSVLGAGLLERAYHKYLKYELNLRGTSFLNERSVPVIYKKITIDADLRCDLFTENILMVELKAVDKHFQFTRLSS